MNPQRESIIVVDDDSEILRALELELGDYYNITSLLSAEQALIILQSQSFSAIISDVKMPGIDGLSLIKQCAVRYPDMVRIILTAVDNKDVYQAAISTHGAYKLMKPWGDDLIITLQNSLKQRKSKLDLQQSLDLNSGALSLDLRIHLKLQENEILTTTVSEMLRVPDVFCAAIYYFDTNGNPLKPIPVSVPQGSDVPSLVSKKTIPIKNKDNFLYTVPIGFWPNPLAAISLSLLHNNVDSIRYLDFVGRQAFKTLLVISTNNQNESAKKQDLSSSIKTEKGVNSIHKSTLLTADWLSAKLSIPSTIIVSAAYSLKEMLKKIHETNKLYQGATDDLDTIATDLDLANDELNELIDQFKTIRLDSKKE